ncbi:LAMI_0E13696g1_1 [Lachancea mirantina]|uniref:Pre-mRNA-processing factor 17 n=1 Tax=Lachancea mirantina TaxID=1230905 RepID=A0A1G4JR14_9SACH|nr:LAMI_0E13696g1_1 [Lachancea mirantina]
MSLVQNYSSSSDSDSEHEIESRSYLRSANPQNESPTNDRTNECSLTIQNSRKPQDTESALSLKRPPTAKRLHVSKAELRKKRRKRKGKSPWASWSSSEEDGEATDNPEVGGSNGEDEAFNGEYTEDPEPASSSALEKVNEESSTFYGSSLVDYQGRGILHPPAEIDIDFQKEPLSFECYTPKRIIHEFEGHTGGVTSSVFLPNSGHLFLSGGNDNAIKLWDVYHNAGLLRDYIGHSKAVREVQFSSTGETFSSVSFDRTVKIWDTETAKVLHRLPFSSIPNCSVFHPSNPSEILVGLSDSKIQHFDMRIPTKQGLVQVYDHHMSSILSLAYFPDGSRFISSSGDKTVRIWENQINIPIKQISDTSQYSMPYIAVHPERRYFAAQSMDNKIYTYSMKPKYKRNPKKCFTGHQSAGYGIGLGFSPDGRYISSGDSKGHLLIWDWKTTRMLKELQTPSKKPIVTVSWHPQETSKVICAGNGGKIYLYD